MPAKLFTQAIKIVVNGKYYVPAFLWYAVSSIKMIFTKDSLIVRNT